MPTVFGHCAPSAAPVPKIRSPYSGILPFRTTSGQISAHRHGAGFTSEAGLIDLKAVALAGALFALAMVDYFTNDGAVFVFLGKKLFDLIALIEFWR